MENIANPTSAYHLEARTRDVVDDQTPRRLEVWTMSCLMPDGLAGQTEVLVDRGERVDVGRLCRGEAAKSPRKSKRK